MVDGVKFKSLKSLILVWVPIDEQVIRYLTTACRLIEEFLFCCCTGHKKFSVHGLQNLGRVNLASSEADQIIDISASNLAHFSYLDIVERNIQFPNIKLASCKNLKTFHLRAHTLSTTSFCEFVSNFPFLEDVQLHIHTLENKFKLSSSSLRKFEIGDCSNMEEIKIDAPNLLLFRYNGNLPPPIFFVSSTSAKWEACLLSAPFNRVDVIWVYKLNQFLNETSKFRVLDLHVQFNTDPVNVNELKATRNTPHELDHLGLEFKPTTMAPIEPPSSATLDAIFWCCRPSSLSCSFPRGRELSNFEAWRNFFKYVYEKLLNQEDQCLKEIQIVVNGGFSGEKVFADISSLLDALPSLRVWPKILFRTKRKAMY